MICNNILRWIIMLALMFVAVIARASSCSIVFLRLEYNAIYNGKQSLCAHFNVDVSGLKGEKIKVTMVVGSVGSSEQDVSIRGYASEECVAIYETSIWEDFKIYLPYTEINLYSGEHTYHVIAFVEHAKQRLSKTYCEEFTMKGPVQTLQSQNSQENLPNIDAEFIINSDKTAYRFYTNGQVIRQDYKQGVMNNTYGTYSVTSSLGSDYRKDVCIRWKNGYTQKGYISYTSSGRATLHIGGRYFNEKQ